MICLVISIVIAIPFWYLLEWINKDLFYDMEFDMSFYIGEDDDTN